MAEAVVAMGSFMARRSLAETPTPTTGKLMKGIIPHWCVDWRARECVLPVSYVPSDPGTLELFPTVGNRGLCRHVPRILLERAAL